MDAQLYVRREPMANQEQLELLNQSVTVWNTWRQEHPNILPDPSDANLGNANLSHANLSGARLINSNLSGADLSNTDLSHARLGVDFDLSSGAIPNGADL